MITQESVDSYEKLRRDGTLGKLQANALRMIAQYPERTSREYADLYFNIYNDSNPLESSIQPRISELEREGYIHRPYRRVCTRTGKTVGVFAIREEIQNELFDT